MPLNYVNVATTFSGQIARACVVGHAVEFAASTAVDIPRNRVLVVDDDPSVRETFRRVLQAEGFDVMVVATGEEALQVLRHDDTVGVMLLDLEMPDMDGAAVRRAQLADGTIPRVPTVIVSGSRSTRSDLTDLTADGYLDKPVGRLQLLTLVRQYCAPARDSQP